MDPATQAAIKSALIGGRGPPSAYGMLTQRAAMSPLMGPGGPPLPMPGGGANAG
jgi:hypothetical protein